MNKDKWRYIIGALFVATFIAALIGIFIQSGNTAAFVTILAIMAGALIIILLLPYLKEFHIGPKGVGGKISQLEGRQKNVESQMQAIQFTLMGLVTKNKYPKLAGLAQERAFLVNYHLDMYQELKRLDAMEFVKPKKGQGLVDIQKQYAHRESDKFDLKYFVEITTRGREYLNLRDKITQAGLS